MGDIAEMMLTGIMCAECGDFLDSFLEGEEESGYPELCKCCKED